MLGSLFLSSGYYDIYYKKALHARALVKDAYDNLFKRFDIILSPVSPSSARKLGELTEGDPLKMHIENIFTASVNLAGLPAAALPCGLDRHGLPTGFQLIGDSFSENKLVNAARIYQSRTDFHRKKTGEHIQGLL